MGVGEHGHTRSTITLSYTEDTLVLSSSYFLGFVSMTGYIRQLCMLTGGSTRKVTVAFVLVYSTLTDTLSACCFTIPAR